MKTNLNNKTIELTKTEMNAAMTYGTEAYRALQEMRRDYPGFRVVELKPKKNKADFAELNMKTIRAYVAKNGSEAQKSAFEFISKRTVDEDGEYHEPQSFFNIKKWFLDEFPEVKAQRRDYRKMLQTIYDDAAAKALAARKAAKADADDAAAKALAAKEAAEANADDTAA